MTRGLLLVCLLGCRIEVEAPPDQDEDGNFDGEDCAPDDPDLPQMWFRDQDGDGFGDPTVALMDCVRPDSYVENDLDCNDGNADAFPEQIWYLDADQDGYGENTESVTQCLQPDSYAVVRGDCDDTSADYNPSASERCDGVDNNCDGQVDEELTDTYYPDADGDGFGDPTSPIEACDELDGHVQDDSDCDDTSDEVHPEAEELCRNGRDDNCDGVTDICEYSLENGSDALYYGGTTDALAGCDLGRAGDINGDGYSDLVIGAWGYSGSLDQQGAAYVVLGPLETLEDGASEPKTNLNGADIVIEGGNADDWFGERVHGVGDVNGDGYDDLAVTTLRWDDSGSGKNNVGAAYVFYGPLESGTSLDLSAHEPDLLYSGENQADWLGGSLGWGDLDGDGLSDMIIGITGRDLYSESGVQEASNNGGYFVVYGGTAPGMRDEDVHPLWMGQDSESAGQAPIAADFDGDGFDDLALGVRKHEFSRGVVYLIDGPVETSGALQEHPAIYGAENYDQFGTGVAAGDLTGDGLVDTNDLQELMTNLGTCIHDGVSEETPWEVMVKIYVYRPGR